MSLKNNSNNSIDGETKLSSRESLLKLNPDRLFGVYKIKKDNNEILELELVENSLVAYQNQLQNLNIPETYNNTNILDLNKLRKREVAYLKKGTEEIKDTEDIVLVSNGVMEYFTGLDFRKYFISTLRDGGTVDKLGRTTVAGRNEGKNLIIEAEKELCEESPFLAENKNGEKVLVIPKGIENSITYTKNSVLNWLETKYNLDRKNKEEKILIEMFEEEFPGVKYEDLGRIIKEIIKNERFEFYNWKKGHIEGTEESIKVIKLGNLEIIVWIFHDKENNTIEYRFIREITAFPEGIRTIGSNPTRLYLESQNQVPKLHYVGNADIKQELNLVPAIKEICKQHRQWIESLMKSNIWFLD